MYYDFEKESESMKGYLCVAVICVMVLTGFFKLIMFMSWTDVSSENIFHKSGDILTLNPDSANLVIGHNKHYKDYSTYFIKSRSNDGILEVLKFDRVKFIESDEQSPCYGYFVKKTSQRNSITGEERIDEEKLYPTIFIMPTHYEISEVGIDFDKEHR